MKFYPEDPDNNSAPLNFFQLLDDSIKFIIEHEDFDAFRAWLFKNIQTYMTPETPFPAIDTVPAEIMARGLLREIWNVVPLPGNGFRPSPIPKPKRNSPCSCGSGKKFKQCCQGLADVPPLPAEVVWSLVLEHLSSKQKTEAFRKKAVPLEAIEMVVNGYIDEGMLEEAAQLAEPLFFPIIIYTNETSGFIMEELCTAYDDLELRDKKHFLLDHVIEKSPKSPLRSCAHQRKTLIFLDLNKIDEAWASFKRAMADTPGSAVLSILEIQILMVEGRFKQAGKRAQFWISQLKRDRLYDNEKLIEHLQHVVDNPEGDHGFVSGIHDAVPGFLPALVKTALDSSLPSYKFSPIEPLDLDDMSTFRKQIHTQLTEAGIGTEDLEEILDEVVNKQRDGMEPLSDEEDDYTLMPSKKLVDVESLWKEVFPLPKPFGVQFFPHEHEEAWSPDIAYEWASFLHDHPEAFDSLDILDDLATALLCMPGSTRATDDRLAVPILKRAWTITKTSVPEGKGLDWRSVENRPALRPLARLLSLKDDKGERDNEYYTMIEEFLALNHNDNHGFRADLMNHYLQSDRNQQALELAGRYPDDMLPEIPYGRVLALFRLGEKKQASKAFKQAFSKLPKVAKALVRSSMKKPKISPQGVTFGGKDQAWLYRDAMRDGWLKTRGIMTWLKSEIKR